MQKGLEGADMLRELRAAGEGGEDGSGGARGEQTAVRARSARSPEAKRQRTQSAHPTLAEALRKLRHLRDKAERLRAAENEAIRDEEWRRHKELEAKVAWRDVLTKEAHQEDDEQERIKWHAAHIKQDEEWQDANAKLRDAAVVARRRAVDLDRELREDRLEQAAGGPQRGAGKGGGRPQAAMQAIVHAVQDLAHKFDAGPVVGTPLEVMGAIANLSDAMQVLEKALAIQAGGAGRPVLTAERAEQEAPGAAGDAGSVLSGKADSVSAGGDPSAADVAMADAQRREAGPAGGGAAEPEAQPTAGEAGTPARVAGAPAGVAGATAPEGQPLAGAAGGPEAPLRSPPRTSATPFSPYPGRASPG